MKIAHTRKLDAVETGLTIDLEDKLVFIKFGPSLPDPRPGWNFKSDVCLGGVLHCLRLEGPHGSAYWFLDRYCNLIYTNTAGLLKEYKHPDKGHSLFRWVFTELLTTGSRVDAYIDVARLIEEFAVSAVADGMAPKIEMDLGTTAASRRAAEIMHNFTFHEEDIPSELRFATSDRSFERGYIEISHSQDRMIRFDRFLPVANFWHAAFPNDCHDPHVCLLTHHTKVPGCVIDTEMNVVYCEIDPTKAGVRIEDVVCIVFFHHFLTAPLHEAWNTEKSIGIVLRENHIGHYIWNELSCVDAILRQGKIPTVFAYPSSNEPLVPLSDVYPEAVIERGKLDFVRAVEASSSGVRFFPFMAYRVRQSLADRVLKQSYKTEITFAEILRVKKVSHTILLIGLRLENRSWIRQEEGYSALLRMLDQVENQKFLVLFDGHNLASDGQGYFRSFGEGGAEGDIPPIVQQEIDLVQAVRLQAERDGLTSVSIDNLVPCSAAISIIAADLADYFITHWGAGLAKYKWIANSPGFIISSSAVLTKKGDLRIYDAEEFRENAVALDYCPAGYVNDLGSDRNLIQTGYAAREDFDIEPEIFAKLACASIMNHIASLGIKS